MSKDKSETSAVGDVTNAKVKDEEPTMGDRIRHVCSTTLLVWANWFN